MIKLFSENELKNAGCREKLPIECKGCHKTFYKAKNQILAIIKGETNMIGEFCSHKCSGSCLITQSTVNCDKCGTSFKKRQSQIKKTKHNFCCHSCSASYQNTHKTTGTRISKMEIWIQDQLKLLYPKPDFFTFNKKDVINSELDIYIPSLKLAFELNGIFHYEPIYGDKKLSLTQLNDERKFKLCSDNNISLCIIDTSSIKYYKPKNMQKFLDIIVKIIEKKMDSEIGIEPL